MGRVSEGCEGGGEGVGRVSEGCEGGGEGVGRVSEGCEGGRACKINVMIRGIYAVRQAGWNSLVAKFDQTLLYHPDSQLRPQTFMR